MTESRYRTGGLLRHTRHTLKRAFLEFSLCVSRACLGKIIILYKNGSKSPFFHHAPYECPLRFLQPDACSNVKLCHARLYIQGVLMLSPKMLSVLCIMYRLQIQMLCNTART